MKTEAYACGLRDEVAGIMQTLANSAERLSSASESVRGIAFTSHDALSGCSRPRGIATADMASVESCSIELSENVDFIQREATATASVFQIAATDIAATIANAASTLERGEDIAEAAQAIVDQAKQLGSGVASFSQPYHRVAGSSVEGPNP
ncbi:MAG: hypothetical protein DI537_35385 [Stutzerimonas stutzeri]|nr:MAG: hypothetical protein DI537_35385 [Stutzerimonas stutzeri]